MAFAFLNIIPARFNSTAANPVVVEAPSQEVLARIAKSHELFESVINLENAPNNKDIKDLEDQLAQLRKQLGAAKTKRDDNTARYKGEAKKQEERFHAHEAQQRAVIANYRDVAVADAEGELKERIALKHEEFKLSSPYGNWSFGKSNFVKSVKDIGAVYAGARMQLKTADAARFMASETLIKGHNSVVEAAKAHIEERFKVEQELRDIAARGHTHQDPKVAALAQNALTYTRDLQEAAARKVLYKHVEDSARIDLVEGQKVAATTHKTAVKEIKTARNQALVTAFKGAGKAAVGVVAGTFKKPFQWINARDNLRNEVQAIKTQMGDAIAAFKVEANDGSANKPAAYAKSVHAGDEIYSKRPSTTAPEVKKAAALAA